MSEGIRTPDRLDHNQELYQLSYAHHAAERQSSAGRWRAGGTCCRRGGRRVASGERLARPWDVIDSRSRARVKHELAGCAAGAQVFVRALRLGEWVGAADYGAQLA